MSQEPEDDVQADLTAHTSWCTNTGADTSGHCSLGTAYDPKARDYATCRPPYASDAIDGLVAVTGMTSDWMVADIGCGTGAVARQLVAHVKQVIGVEPSGPMREEADLLLGGTGRFTSVAATAEETTLAKHSVDLITLGQAVHWFDPEKSRREFARILKPHGWLAFVWNRFGDSPDPDLAAFGGAHNYRAMSVPMVIREGWERYLGGARSAAGAPSPGDTAYPAFEAAQQTFFEANAIEGILAVHYTTELRVASHDALDLACRR